MACEKHSPRASVTTKTSALGLGFCLLSPEGHVFHKVRKTMIKSYSRARYTMRRKCCHFLSLFFYAGVILTIFGTASDKNFVKILTFTFHCGLLVSRHSLNDGILDTDVRKCRDHLLSRNLQCTLFPYKISGKAYACKCNHSTLS